MLSSAGQPHTSPVLRTDASGWWWMRRAAFSLSGGGARSEQRLLGLGERSGRCTYPELTLFHSLAASAPYHILVVPGGCPIVAGCAAAALHALRDSRRLVAEGLGCRGRSRVGITCVVFLLCATIRAVPVKFRWVFHSPR